MNEDGFLVTLNSLEKAWCTLLHFFFISHCIDCDIWYLIKWLLWQMWQKFIKIKDKVSSKMYKDKRQSFLSWDEYTNWQ